MYAKCDHENCGSEIYDVYTFTQNLNKQFQYLEHTLHTLCYSHTAMLRTCGCLRIFG